MFKIGDKVSYPMHGAGVITDISTEMVLNEERRYYTIKVPVGNVLIRVPVDNAEELGVRYIIDDDVRKEIIETLSGEKTKMPSNWNRRNRINSDKLKTGDILEVSSVVRNLMLLSKQKNLSSGDRKMLQNATNLLLSELILAYDISEEEGMRLISHYVFGEKQED